MSEHAHNTYELIEKYCLDLMDEKERHYFELEMEKNPALRDAVEDHRTLLLSFNHVQNVQFVHDTLDAIHNHSRSHTDILLQQMKLYVSKYWRTASVAASVAFIASTLTFLAARLVYKKDTHAQYIELTRIKGDINRVKNAQNKMSSEMSEVKKKITSEQPVGESKSTGTGFALTQKGYFVTNLHVVKDFKGIFVFTADNIGHKCEVVASDEVNDLAVLRVIEKDFSFNSRIPYSLVKATPNIAQRIYSLGYPKEDIVYNEGYISSVTGFEGDSNRYQLELPSDLGMSGAPVIDETGNVLGIISGKQSQTEGVTFAVRTKSLLSLFKSLPKDFNSAELSSNYLRGSNRASQVKKIQPFVCVVRVYN